MKKKNNLDQLLQRVDAGLRINTDGVSQIVKQFTEVRAGALFHGMDDVPEAVGDIVGVHGLKAAGFGNHCYLRLMKYGFLHRGKQGWMPFHMPFRLALAGLNEPAAGKRYWKMSFLPSDAPEDRDGEGKPASALEDPVSREEESAASRKQESKAGTIPEWTDSAAQKRWDAEDYRNLVQPFLTLSASEYLEYVWPFIGTGMRYIYEGLFLRDIVRWKEKFGENPSVADILCASAECMVDIERPMLDMTDQHLLELLMKDAELKIEHPFRRANLNGKFWPQEQDSAELAAYRIWHLMFVLPIKIAVRTGN